jgi:hypothetical protein
VTTLADILTPGAAAASPAEIGSVAAQLQSISDTAASVRERLSGLCAARWTGAAAAAYCQAISEALPNELSKITTSFGIAAQALKTYLEGFDGPYGVLPRAQALVAQANEANEQLTAAQAALVAADQARDEARAAQAAASEPVSAAKASSALDSAEHDRAVAKANVDAANDAGRRIQNLAQALRDELDQFAQACAQRLHDASEAGIRDNLFSYFERHDQPFLSEVTITVGEEIMGAGRAVRRFVDDTSRVLHDEARLGYGLAQLVLDPNKKHLMGLLHDDDRLAHDYSDWVSAAEPILLAVAVVAVAAICVAQPELAPAALGITLEAYGDASMALDASKLASDGYLLMRRQANLESLADDVTAVVLDRFPGGSGLDDSVRLGETSKNVVSSLNPLAGKAERDAARILATRPELALPDIKAIVVSGAGAGLSYLEHKLAPIVIKRADSLLLGSGPSGGSWPAMSQPSGLTSGPSSMLRITCNPLPVPLVIDA